MKIKDLISNLDDVENKFGSKDQKDKKKIDISNLSKRTKKSKQKNSISKRKESMLFKRGKKYEDLKVKIEINSNLCSKNISKVKFSNYLKGDNGDKECIAVKHILGLNNKTIKNSEIPFVADEDKLNIKNRHEKIMRKMNIDIEPNLDIQKSTYRDKVSQTFNLLSHKGEGIRVYYIDKTETNRKFEIILIDPHHLFATTIYDNYGKVKKYKYDMRRFV